MPAYTRGQLRDQIRFVKLNTVFLYGWATKDLSNALGITESDLSTQLGHLTASAAAAISNRIMVTGANSPKPARVVKRDPTAPVSQVGSTSTFIAFDKLAAATTAGWRLASRSRGVQLKAPVDGQRSMSAVAELSNGLLYVFSMNKADFDQHGTALGLTSAATINTATERNKLSSGSRTKPGRCSQPQQAGGDFSSYYATSAADGLIAAGYSILTDEYIEYAAASGGGGGGA